ncbi:hypothetical protein [Haloarcula sediminis]|uniref:hypothetical protein n=1 Tax=Haloarcula sediminis TaxID=3111777 RepID=UPI002D78ADFF|nr:hypothetical protein [Haloarcula sp. CK38]
MKRRQAIIAAVGFAAPVTGCAGNQSGDGAIDLTVINQSDTPYTVEIGFFRDDEERNEARAYDATLDIEADGRETREAVVSAGRYLVRYSAYEENSRLTDEDHIHYISAESDTDGLILDIRETGTVTRR